MTQHGFPSEFQIDQLTNAATRALSKFHQAMEIFNTRMEIVRRRVNGDEVSIALQEKIAQANYRTRIEDERRIGLDFVAAEADRVRREITWLNDPRYTTVNGSTGEAR